MNRTIGTLFVLAAATQIALAERKPLVLWPDAVGKVVHEAVHCVDRPLGYTPREMAFFPGRQHYLPYVISLFQDAPNLPVETDRLARRFLAGGYEGALATAFGLLTAKPVPESTKQEAAKQDNTGAADTAIVPADAASKATWEALPEPIRRGVEQLVRAAMAARPGLYDAFDWNALARRTGDRNIGNLGSYAVYDQAAGPWTHPGSRSSGSYAALNSFRPAKLAAAGAAFAGSMRQAIGQLCAIDKDTKIPPFETCTLGSAAGSVRILGAGNNAYRGRDAIVVDLGGNDVYTGRVAVPRSYQAPVGILVDLGGNDVYDGRQASASIACGLFGIGALFDLGGNDRYACRESGLGCAWHGIGLLVDTRGDDTYAGFRWCEGAAHAGVGMLIDENGADRYTCQLESQGLGSTLGVGVLIDQHGNDRYHAYDNEAGRTLVLPSTQTSSHEASIVQGAGYGRRADTTDGHYLAGGVGALVDGDGDDSYYGGVFSQGIGFWWSFGMLADLGGNDRYRGVYYAQGAAAHFAIGSVVNRGGDDQYNNREVLGQAVGSGRDGSVGTFVDTAGNDVYYLPKKSAGGGDMNSVGLFCDQQGNDTYHASGYAHLGGATFSNPRGEYFRQRMPTVGVFVDLAGTDKYPSYGRAKNHAAWYHQSGGTTWGYGLDMPVPARKKTK